MPQPKTPTPTIHHRARTFFAAVFGIIALSLILDSLLLIWVNRTLTDTPTYVQTMAPLVSKPAVQTFIVEKATDKLLEVAPAGDLAGQLLPPAETAGKTEEQLRTQLRVVLADDIKQILGTPQFAELWKSTNESAHAQLKQQIITGGGELTLDLSPAVSGAIAQLKASKLAAVASKLEVPADAGKFNIKNGSIDKAHQYYVQMQQGTIAIVVITILTTLLSIFLSVHHLRTLRRILIGTGVTTLLLAALIQAPSIIDLGASDPTTQAAAIAITEVLFHNLQIASLVIGVGCIAVAIVSKLAERTGQTAARK